MPLLTERLKAEGTPFEILFHQPTFHAREEAHRLGIPLENVVKTILIVTRTGHALAVIPASRRLDMRLVHQAIGGAEARLATEPEIGRRYPGYPLGALPPLSGELEIPIYVDPQVAAHQAVVFAVNESESLRVPTEAVICGETACLAPLVSCDVEAEEEASLEPIPTL